jgi:hypothetical protein
MVYTAAGSGQGRRKNIMDAYIQVDSHILPEEENGYICMRRTVVYILSKIIEVILARSLDLQAEEAKIF